MPRRALALLVLGLTACSAPLQDLPPDAALDSELHEAYGFALYVEPGALDDAGRDALVQELDRARERIEGWLGPALAPGDFRPVGTPRAHCPPDWEFGPRPASPRVPVVVRKTDLRCHADAQGITLGAVHLAERHATHELVHYLAGSSWHPVDEGLAVYLTERLWGGAAGVPLKIRARVYRDLNLKGSLAPRVLHSEGMSRRDYDVSGAFVGWLIETYGKAKFLQLYAGAERNYYGVYLLGERDLLERFWKAIASLDVRGDSDYYRFQARLTDLDE
ncbi:MAG: hypothetical protein R3F62_03020 [Planctomycetota bacterium]